MFQLLDYAKSRLSEDIARDGVLVDFTMGNGHDTLYLSGLVPEGKVYAFDVQEMALVNTRRLLDENGRTNVTLIHDSHEHILKYVEEEIDGGMFNLGYLPGSDKVIHTMRTSTELAVNGALERLKKGGHLVISVYPGHDEGRLEGELLLDMLSKLDRKKFCAMNFRILNAADSPFVIAIEKYKK